MIIETERLRLEPWHGRYLEEFVRLASDPAVMRHIGSGAPWSRERSEERFTWQLDHWRRHRFGWRSAIERSSGEWLGFVGVNYVRFEAIELDPGEVEIGWWLSPSAWGRGLASEGAIAVRDEAFERLGLERLVGRCQPQNAAGARIMEKIGMHPEREARGRHSEAVWVYGLERDRWLTNAWEAGRRFEGGVSWTTSASPGSCSGATDARRGGDA